MEIYLPWRLRKLAIDTSSNYHYRINLCASNFRARCPDGKLKILFCVPFYGYTGGSFAVISAANLLSEVCNVSFLTKASNVMNKYVSSKVRMVSGVAEHYDFCVVESGIDFATLTKVRLGGARVILTMHGAPPMVDGTKNHGYCAEQITNMMVVADSVQYVSDIQLPFFDRFPAVNRRRIPNYVWPIDKYTKSHAVGVVCDTTLPHKNAYACIEAAELSKATRIEIWGKYFDKRSTGRTRWNGFTNDKQRIYSSFSVLVHLSKLENQPLVILEALSAGIPCVLAQLPAYEHLRGLNGLLFVDEDDRAAVSQAINTALDCSEDVREGLVKFWEENHSPRAIRAMWIGYLEDIRTLSGSMLTG